MKVEEYADIAFAAQVDAEFRLRLRGLHAVGHRRFPAAGLEAGRDHGRAGSGVAEEHLAVRLADSEHRGARDKLRPAGRDAAQSGGRQIAGRFHRVALQRQGNPASTSSSTSTAASRAPSARRSKSIRLWGNGKQSSFIGLDKVGQVSYDTHRNENTRCYFCKNKCLRTFIDVKVVGAPVEEQEQPRKSKIPILPGVKRLIVGNSCDKGLVEDVNDMKVIKKGMDEVKAANPNFVEVAAKAVWRSFNPPNVADPPHKFALTQTQKQRNELVKRRAKMRIGIPRVLNQYSVNPLFSAYFESLGVPPQNLIYSDYTTEQLYKEGAKRGAIDPCFPSKVGIPHVHNLLHVHHKKKPLDMIFFPMIDALPSDLFNTLSSRACPTVTTTPEAVKAAFIKEGNLFDEMGIKYLNPILNIDKPRFLEKQMYEAFKDILGLTQNEHHRAIEEGLKALDNFYNVQLRGAAREALNQLEAEDKLGVVVLARPYHNDPGLNHEILEEFQKLGYPVFTMDSSADG